MTKVNNLFCGLHYLIGLAETAEATVKLWSSHISQGENGRDKEFCEADEGVEEMEQVRWSTWWEAWLGGDLWTKVSQEK